MALIPLSAPRMSMIHVVWIMLLCLLAPVSTLAQERPSPTEASSASARTLVHLLDYIAQDYPGAVANGEVTNAFEYAEMQEFSTSVAGLLEDLGAQGVLQQDGSLNALSDQLGSAIANNADPVDVAAVARSIREAVIREAALQVAPQQWPDAMKGQVLFTAHCVDCHGASGAGDGPLAPQLNPAPSNLAAGERIAAISPFQIYNTVRLGVEGTAMAPFHQLTDAEIWNIAFFVKTLQSAADYPEAQATNAADVRALRRMVSLEQMASMGDPVLTALLDSLGVDQPNAATATLRLAEVDQDAGTSLTQARRYLEEARTMYAQGETSAARQRAIVAYLEGIEPVEPTLRATEPSLTAMLESRMMEVRSAIEQNKPAEAVSEAIDVALASIAEAESALHENEPSPWFAFLLAASILLREGLEAFLIILAILGVIRAAGSRKAAMWVHAGWMLALLVGIIAWFFSDLLLQFGATQRELMEGGISLLAVGVLLYVGFWLHSKTEIRKWKEFIDVRVQNMLQGGNLFGLAVISFFAVFREAFESVLFLSALTLEEGSGSKTAIAAGAVLAIAAVLILAAVLLRYSARLPIRNLFRYSSFVMGVLAIMLVGKGLHAFQETGLMSITSAPLSLRLDLLGIYPTVETLVAQGSILLLVVLLWNLPKLKARQEAAPRLT